MGARTVRVAVVGSGPAGFYAAGRLLQVPDPEIAVDVIERLPTPWGLIRFGVAPDHPKIKTVSRVFEQTATHSRFRFLGNVEVGTQVSRSELKTLYDAVIYAIGACDDRSMGIPGEELPGVVAATELVAWYNGHPEACELDVSLDCERAVVVGNGNVALDVARMLLLGHDALATTDVADHALSALGTSAVREVVVLGRRGPAQASFTTAELLELGELPDVAVVVEPTELERALRLSDPAVHAASLRNVEVLRRYAAQSPQGRSKRLVLRFLASPVAVLGDGAAEAVRVAHNQLVAEGGRVRAQATGAYETLPAGLVVRAIGYCGVPLPDVPFDPARGVIANHGGRVAGTDGEYATGWVKRGPSGVIGTNKRCAQETVAALLEDLATGRLPLTGSATPEEVTELLAARRPHVVGYDGWQRIDRHERALGRLAGRPRVKVVRMPDLLGIARSGAPETVGGG